MEIDITSFVKTTDLLIYALELKRQIDNIRVGVEPNDPYGKGLLQSKSEVVSSLFELIEKATPLSAFYQEPKP